MKNLIFQDYISELKNIYHSLSEESTGDSDIPYTGGRNLKGHPHGRGRMKFQDGSIYEGFFKEGKKNGQGTYIFAHGDALNRVRYEGNWYDDLMQGKGRMIWSSGDKYTGEWQLDNITGFGIMELSSGEKFEGNWKNGLKDGKFIFYNKAGEKSEEEWADGKLISGKLTLNYDDGSSYVGQIKDGKRHGKGILHYSANDKYGRISYDGDWQSDKRQGQGILMRKDKTKYIGSWENDLRKKGREYYENGKVHFECTWENGKKEGEGITYWDNGEIRFIGIFRNDKHFRGKYMDNDTGIERTWEGEFDERGYLVNGQYLYHDDGGTYENCEVSAGQYTNGLINYQGHTFRGQFSGILAEGDNPVPLNGYSEGWGGRYGEIRNGNLNGIGRMEFTRGHPRGYYFKEFGGYVMSIDGNFVNGNPDGDVIVTFEDNKRYNGYGDGNGTLSVSR